MSVDLFPVIALGVCVYGLVIIWSRGQKLYALAGSLCWIVSAFTDGVLQNVMALLGALLYIGSATQVMRWLKRKSKDTTES